MMKPFTLTVLLSLTVAMVNGQSAKTVQQRTDASTSLSATANPAEAVKATEKVDVYNAGSLIFNDPRTPRYPLVTSEQENIANYNRSKQVWIQNNPQLYSELNRSAEPTEEQLRQRREAVGK